MRKRGEDDLRVLPGRVVSLDQLVTMHPLAGGRLGGRERDRGAGMAVEQAQQLLTDITGGTQDAHRDGCMIIHFDGKLCNRKGPRKVRW